jgi:hypothetical protein
MTKQELIRRRSEDFKFLVLCDMKGNHGMYQFLRDRDLDKYQDVDPNTLPDEQTLTGKEQQ